jgi:hypothetical protein
MRVASVRAARRKLVKMFKKPNSKFYWYDFMVRGHRYRGSTQETKSVRAVKPASLKLVSVIESADPVPSKPTALCDVADRFQAGEWKMIGHAPKIKMMKEHRRHPRLDDKRKRDY